MKKIIVGLVLFLIVIGIVKILENKGVISATSIMPRKEQSISTSTASVAVNFLDIGQGDATLLVFSNNEELLVDCAKDAIILSALSRVRGWHDREIDYLVVSHPDADHYAGCIDVLERYRIKKIFLTGYQKNSGPLWSAFIAKVREVESQGTIIEKITEPKKMQIAGIDVHFLYPDHDTSVDPRVPGVAAVESNNTSIVIKVSVGANDVLLTADTEIPLENYLVKKYGSEIGAEILKVGHHGSLSSTDDELLAAVRPEYCVISVGRDNAYGHPVQRVLKRLERHGCKILRTDEQGDILFSVSDQAIIYEQAL